MQDHKLVQALLAALSLKFPDERGFAVKRLESVLGSKSASSLANLKLAVDEAWSKKQSVKQTDPNYAAVMQKWYQVCPFPPFQCEEFHKLSIQRR